MQIIPERQAGRFAIFSSETDAFVARNVREKDVFKFFEDIAVEQTRDRVTRIFEKIEAGEKPFHQFTLTIEEAEEKDRQHRT